VPGTASLAEEVQDGQPLCSGPCVPRQRFHRALYNGQVIGGKIRHLVCYAGHDFLNFGRDVRILTVFAFLIAYFSLPSLPEKHCWNRAPEVLKTHSL
jgi:hypothetical protein